MTLPNFLLIGAPKCGTTAIAQYLSQHPEIFMSSVKEPFFFSLQGKEPNYSGPGDNQAFKLAVAELQSYRKLFSEVSNETAIGEASTNYLYSLTAPKDIKRLIPSVKLIAVLRNPVDRAYASYLHLVRDGYETSKSFSVALDKEEERKSQNWMHLWHYKSVGLYSNQLERYLSLFDPSQIKVCLYDDFTCDPELFLMEMFDFLEVEQSFSPDLSIRYNVSGIPKSHLIHQLMSTRNPFKTILKPFIPPKLRQFVRYKNLEKPSIDNEVKRKLEKIFLCEILELQDLIDRDLSHWY